MSQPLWPDVATYNRATQIGRENWQVTLTAQEVRTEAAKAANHHRERESWWKTEAETAKAKIGDEGLSVREQQVTGGMRHDVVVDPTLSARLNECEQKAQQHRGQAEALERYDALLGSLDPATVLVLTASDASFFELGRF